MHLKYRKSLGGRGSASDPAWGSLAGGRGPTVPPQEPIPLSALRVSSCGPLGLAEPVSRNEEIKIWSPYGILWCRSCLECLLTAHACCLYHDYFVTWQTESLLSGNRYLLHDDLQCVDTIGRNWVTRCCERNQFLLVLEILKLVCTRKCR